MKTFTTKHLLTLLIVTLAMMAPVAVVAQSDGGKKKKKKARTEQTTPARKPTKKQSAPKPASKQTETIPEQKPEPIPELTPEQKPEQKIEPAKQTEDEIFTTVEQKAEFPGGQNALVQWLAQNIRYPENAVKNNIQGRVLIKFVVEKDGAITNISVARSVDKDLDNEALRIVMSMPKWQPGKMNAMPVRSYAILPITFRFN